MSCVGLPAVGFRADGADNASFAITEEVFVEFVSIASRNCLIPSSNISGHLVVEIVPEDVAETAGCAWHAGLALSRHLGESPRLVRGFRVCELGAGCCIPGLVSALIGAKSVCVSDLAVNMAHMNSILHTNAGQFKCPVSAHEIAFGEPSEFDTDSFDLILGADIGFDLALHSLICATLLNLCSRHTKIILCEEIRWSDIFKWYVEELEKNFEVAISDAPLPIRLDAKKDVKLLHLTLKSGYLHKL